MIGIDPPSRAQLAGAAIILAALLALLSSAVDDYRAAAREATRRVVLFVCGGNTIRSPMAQMICDHLIARHVIPHGGDRQRPSIVALSAGLTAEPGRPLSELAADGLRSLGVEP
jgi:hypothetical protein